MQKDQHISLGNDIVGSTQVEEVSGCSVGIMAYNEEANIAHTIRLVLAQHGPSLRIDEVIVVASGCTDQTVPLVTEIAQQEQRVRLCIQEKREGKASAINLFLKQAKSKIAVLIGADVIPADSALENLCAPLQNPKIGMVGGRPIPINSQATFMGHAVHLLWRLHDRLARAQPKLGEVIAFRNVISGIPTGSPVDEISIQALISQLGYQTVYEPACVVYNKGPLTAQDFLKQRRRIYAGHLQVRDQQKYEASTMKTGPILREVLLYRDFTMRTPRQALWTLGAVSLEALARLQGYYDYLRKHEHYIWQMVESTKDLESGAHALRRLNNALSVIIFRFMLEDPAQDLLDPESDERDATEAVRKLLPVLRTQLRKEVGLSLAVNEPGIMTAIIRAEQHEIERLSKLIQEIVQTTPMRIGMRGREVRVKVAYSSLTFKAENKNLTVSGPLMREAVVATGVSSEGLS
ncbi:MAG TPA: glycosyltransferase [Ktedonobacteraceae bacterium]